MKVLLVVHRFPPHGAAGTETYTETLALALARSGHAVEVLAARKDVGSRDLAVSRRVHRGIPVHEIANNLFHAGFRETWDEPRIDARFGALLDELSPDIVHVQHLLWLSTGCLAEARKRSLPVMMTLHDYWLSCPRFGQRLHWDGGLCATIDYDRCGTCLARFKYAQGPLERRVGRAIAGVRDTFGLDLGPLARGARGAADRLARGRAARPAPAREPPDADRSLERQLAGLARERALSLLERALAGVDHFAAPSRFLRERFVEWGLPPERVEHLPFGVDRASFASRPRRPRGPRVRVGFLGSLIPVKGAELLLDAWERLEPACRARGELVIAGPANLDPAHASHLAHRARSLGAGLHGAVARESVPEHLASTDLLVVPSLWWENSPLVILEALAARTPLLVADQGGMAELVEPGRDGWRFATGDADDLARHLAHVLDDPARLDALSVGSAPLSTFDEHVAALVARYRRLAGVRRVG